MTPDTLDDRLDAAAPATQAADPAQLRTMIAAARREARPQRTRHGIRVGVALGLTTLLAAGGGVALAGGLIDWAPRYDNPDNSFEFTLASGRICESRLIVESATGDEGADQDAARDIEQSLRTWLQTTDLQASFDLERAARDDAEIVATSPDQTIVIGPDGWLMDVPQLPSTRSADDVEAFVIDRALRNQVLDHVAAEGVDLHVWSILGGVKCAAVAP